MDAKSQYLNLYDVYKRMKDDYCKETINNIMVSIFDTLTHEEIKEVERQIKEIETNELNNN